MSANTPTHNQYAESLQQIAEILGAPFSPSREIVLRAKELRTDLARVTAERDENYFRAASLVWVVPQDALDGDVRKWSEEYAQGWKSIQADNATLRARVAELESTISTAARGNQSLAERLDIAEQRNAELVAALRAIRDLDDDATAEDCAARAGSALASAETATPAPQSQQIDAESLVAACIPGGSICDPQQVADTIREYLRTQEPCGGRCGDPECDLDTTGVTMRTPAPHADTARTHACPECYGGHFKPCQVCGDTGRMEMRAPAPAASVDEEIARRANNGTFDAAMKGGRP